MTSYHTQAILDDSPVYLTGITKVIQVKGKRPYSHKITVKVKRSLKPSDVRKELEARDMREERLKARIQALLQRKQTFLERLIGKWRNKS